MSIHHLEQTLDILEFPVSAFLFVLVQLGDLLVSHLEEDLLWLLLLQHLGWST